jgi:hypothetical protein
MDGDNNNNIRNRPMELDINLDYLKLLHAGYQSFIKA